MLKAKAALLEAKKLFRWVTLEVPSLKPNEALIRVKMVGICGSEVEAYFGKHPFRRPPVILGHEMSGQVIEVGSDVASLQVGDRVTVIPHVPCGQCFLCLQGRSNLCRNKRILGTTNWPGAFANIITAPENAIIKLPREVAYEHGILIEPLAVAAHAMRRADVTPADTVLVYGLGAIGLCCVIAAKKMGCRHVIGLDIHEGKLKAASKLGADQVINANQKQGIKDAQPWGVSVAFLTVGVPGLLKECLDLLVPHGRLAIVALMDTKESLLPLSISGASSERDILGVTAYSFKDFEAALSLVTAACAMPVKVLPIDQIQVVFESREQYEPEFARIVLSHENETGGVDEWK